jgi:hypothetical protein
MEERRYDPNGLIIHFRKELDMNNREELKDFIESHFRYNTMNSWNGCKSWAHCVKVHHLPLTNDECTKAFDLLDIEEVNEFLHDLIREWERERKFSWQVGFNGRSSGYIVLYQGGVKPDGQRFSWPGRGVDENLDFTDWVLEDFQEKAKFLSEFDLLADQLLTAFVGFIENYEVKNEIIHVPRTVKVLVEKEAS